MISSKSKNPKPLDTTTKTSLSTPVALISGVCWLILFYIALLSGWLGIITENNTTNYSPERTSLIYSMLLVPSSLCIAYGNVKLAKAKNKTMFRAYFIIGAIVILLISAWIGLALNMTIK